ncbi:MAG: type I restriction enzyme HsdR N-terminal domain-containing protein [Symploca sp. SIO2G7]|nr:type I restriction enzyme HsdR N-terminal domain-containing protein [Symploca sp. SIO2G7]
MDLPGGGRGQADIVLYYDGKPWQVLEVKKIINREGVLLGTNQARAYTETLGATEQPLLIGLAPWSEKEYWSGKNAINLSAHNEVGIIYLNEDERWYPLEVPATVVQNCNKNNYLNDISNHCKALANNLLRLILSSFWSSLNQGICKLTWKQKATAVITLCFISFLLSWNQSSKIFNSFYENTIKSNCKCP